MGTPPLVHLPPRWNPGETIFQGDLQTGYLHMYLLCFVEKIPSEYVAGKYFNQLKLIFTDIYF